MTRSSPPPLHPAANHRDPTLIPGLPNDIAAVILSLVPYSHHPRLKPTCKSWRHFLSSQTLINLRRSGPNPNSRSQLLCVFPEDPTISPPYLFDPDSPAWCPLPPLPPNPSLYGLCNFTSVSVGQFLFILGGSHIDARSFPLGRPSASASTFRFDFATRRWDCMAPMISPRGSFACTAGSDEILVAGGGSRHVFFGAAGSRTSSAERYDIARDEWFALDDLPGFRAGCAGFLVRSEDRREFWVMGGYGGARTIGGFLPVDEYYRDAVVLELGDDGEGRWREVGDMWEEQERLSLGKVAIVEDDEFCAPKVFMLNNDEIFRYDINTNRWQKESTLPRKGDSSLGFIALNGELYVLTSLEGVESIETRRLTLSNKVGTLFIQIYNPRNKGWRFLATKPPFHHLDFGTAILCSIRL